MKEITQQVLSDIESIKLSLDALSNQGISVIDSFAPITTGINILTTVFATAFGGWITLLLFKRQEDMRIREDLRLKFYEDYEVKYNNVLISLDNFKNNIGGASKNIFSIGGIHKVHQFEKINTIETLIKDFNSERVQKAIIVTDELVEKMENLEKFMKSKEVIHGYEEFKFKEELKQVKNIKEKFNQLAITKIMVEVFNEINDEGEIITEDYTGNKQKIAVSKPNVTEYIEGYKKEYNELINICEDEKINEIETSIQKNHKEIVDEFIKIYFK